MENLNSSNEGFGGGGDDIEKKNKKKRDQFSIISTWVKKTFILVGNSANIPPNILHNIVTLVVAKHQIIDKTKYKTTPKVDIYRKISPIICHRPSLPPPHDAEHLLHGSHFPTQSVL